MKQAPPVNKLKKIGIRTTAGLSYNVSLTLIKPDSNSSTQFGQQLALIINELLKSGELK